MKKVQDGTSIARGTICAAAFALCFTFSPIAAISQIDNGDQPRWHGSTERTFWVNDSSCSGDIRTMVVDALNLWSFYAGLKLVVAQDPTDINYSTADSKNVIWCESMDPSKSLAAYTQNYGYIAAGLIEESDTVIDSAHIQPCIITHEIGHALGIAVEGAHPDDPIAVMFDYLIEFSGKHKGRTREKCGQTFLTTTDLILLAEAYNRPANCTPYAQNDFSLYFPNIYGFEAKATFNGRDWDIAWATQAPDYRWECDIEITKAGKGVWDIKTDVYNPTICVHANYCEIRKLTFRLEKGRLRLI